MNIFLISDLHLDHARALTFWVPDWEYRCPSAACDATCQKTHPVRRLREFESVEAMNEHMIDRWNAVVRPQDHVYHLGDVAIHKSGLRLVKRLQGHKRNVGGNHDIFEPRLYREAGFEKIFGARVLNNILCTHFPVHPGSLGRFLGNAHGHIHRGQLPLPYLNLSVEAVDYTPVALEDVGRRLSAA